MSRERVGSAYHGALASEYYCWQREIGALGASLNLAKFAPHVSETDVLVDFGCGGGALLAALPGRLKIGVEVSKPARLDAEARGIKTVASADELDPRSVDVVISNHALEHVLEPYVELTALRKALRPGGRLVIWLPLEDWRAERWRRRDLNHHLHAWTPRLLRNLLEEAGFVVIECRIAASAWPPHAQVLARRLPQWAFEALGAATAYWLKRRQIMALAVRSR